MCDRIVLVVLFFLGALLLVAQSKKTEDEDCVDLRIVHQLKDALNEIVEFALEENGSADRFERKYHALMKASRSPGCVDDDRYHHTYKVLTKATQEILLRKAMPGLMRTFMKSSQPIDEWLGNLFSKAEKMQKEAEVC